MPVEIEEVQAGYLQSSYFKDICFYLSQYKLPSSRTLVRKIETLADRYILLDFLLFKMYSRKGSSSACSF